MPNPVNNYIHRLEDELKAANAARNAWRVGVSQLVGYLCSDKFHKDPTVQVRDVMHRLAEVQDAAEDAAFDAANQAVLERRAARGA